MMKNLYVRHIRCPLKSKIYSHSTCNYLLNNPMKLIFLNSQQCLPQFRHYSWDGFYYSVSTSTPVITCQNILLDLHSSSGLPWWAVIMVTTLGIRSLFIFPLTVHQNQVITRLANLNAELIKMAPELNKEVNIAARMYGWDETSAKKVFKQNMRQYYKKFILRDNCHPFKIFLLSIFQVPIWMLFSISLRNLTLNPWVLNVDSQSIQEQLKSEGTLWFTDLTMPDIYMIPILLAVVNLSLIEMHALRILGERSKLQNTLLYASRFITLIVAAAATVNPTSVTFYWLCSSTFGFVQSIILISPKCRRILRIPATTKESSTPFKDIALNFKKRFLP